MGNFPIFNIYTKQQNKKFCMIGNFLLWYGILEFNVPLDTV